MARPGGPLPIGRARFEELAPVHRAFLEACREAGYPGVADHNAPGAVGAGPLPLNALGGVRQSTALTYLAPARGRPNLEVRGGAMVDRVRLVGNRAVGVRLAGYGEEISGGAVILAGGTYGSPAILMRSGIGPAEHLRTIGVAVRGDLDGVGRSLRDHPLLGLRFAAVPPVPQAPFTQAALTLKSSPENPSQDIQILPSSVLATDAEKSPTMAHFMVSASVVKPLSPGRLTLRSADPSDAPLIDPGYFTDPADMPRMIDAVRKARQLSRTVPLSRLSAGELYPGRETTDSDSDLRAAILAKGETYHHAVGTYRMGFAGDHRAVVDSKGKVHGTDRLYVVDASVFPIIPAANTHVPVIMAAERCAAWLAETV